MTTSTTLRPELKDLPYRMQSLPVDDRGYPVPWFVAWVDGKPEFRAMDARKWKEAIVKKRCWVCGQTLGSFLAFVIGPMCGVTRTTSEPPNHLECARWSAQNCPFLSRPRMVRREDGMEEAALPAGEPILRNPGVALIWITRAFSVFDDGKGRPLIKVGDPESIEFYAEGRKATREEVKHSITTGLPILQEAARADPENPLEAMTDLMSAHARFDLLVERYA